MFQVIYQNLVNELIKNFIIFHEDIFPCDGQGTVYEKYISTEPDIVGEYDTDTGVGEQEEEEEEEDHQDSIDDSGEFGDESQWPKSPKNLLNLTKPTHHKN